MARGQPRGSQPIPWHRRLPTRLVAVVLLATLLLALVYAFVGDPALRRLLLETETERLAVQASTTATALSVDLERATDELEALAASPRLRPSRPTEELRADLSLLDEASGAFQAFTVLDDDLRILARPSAPADEGESRADRGYSEALATDETVLEEASVDAAGDFALTLATPLREDGATVGLLTASLGLADTNPRFYAPILAPDLPESWQARLVDERGILLASSDGAVAGADLDDLDRSDDPVVAALRQQGPGSLDVDGWLVEAAEVAGAPWVVIVQESTAAAAGEINTTRAQLAVAAAAAILLAALLALLIGRRTVARVSELSVGLRSLAARGHASRLSDEGQDELADAARAFNRMLAERERTDAELTDRKAELEQAVAARTETLRRYLLALQVGRLGIWEWEVESGEMRWSENMEATFRSVGLRLPASHDELVESIHPEDREAFTETLAETIRVSTPLEVEVRLDSTTGEERWLRTLGGAVADAQGFAERVIGVTIDVTAEHETARELAARAEREHALAELGRLALGEVTADALARDTAEVIGAVIEGAEVRLLEGPGRDGTLRPVGSSVARGEHEAVPAEAIVRDAIVREADGSARFCTSIPGHRGQWGVLEISAPRIGRAESEFAHSIATVLAAAVARLELDAQLRRGQRLEAVGRLAGGIAHDVMDLLTTQLAHLERLGAGLEPPQRAELEEVVRAAHGTATLTDHLLTLSRSTEREPVDVDIAELIRQMRGVLERLVPASVTLEATAEGPAIARIDPNRFEQIVLSLCVNARDAMPEGGRLSLRTDDVVLDDEQAAPLGLEAGRFVRTVVADTGLGMDEATRERAVEPFFTTRPERAPGLGLSSAHGIVASADGALTLESAPGQGTVVTVLLPAITPPSPRPPRAAAPTPPARILLVEDTPEVRELLAAELERAGHVVHAAASCAAASSHLAEHGAPDLIITNFILTDGGGLDLARLARSGRAQPPVLLISGYHQAVVGAGPRTRWLAKPFAPTTLRAAAEEMLREDEPAEA
ncbi:MAG: ATP-binding protein [Actinomycetota bacterium]